LRLMVGTVTTVRVVIDRGATALVIKTGKGHLAVLGGSRRENGVEIGSLGERCNTSRVMAVGSADSETAGFEREQKRALRHRWVVTQQLHRFLAEAERV
jgi:hypothetical protein